MGLRGLERLPDRIRERVSLSHGSADSAETAVSAPVDYLGEGLLTDARRHQQQPGPPLQAAATRLASLAVVGHLVRELDVAAIRLVLRTSKASILEALDKLLPPHSAEEAPPDSEEIELHEGSTKLRNDGQSLVADVGPGELPRALRGILVDALDRRGGALLHGAAVVVEDQAVLCIAPSEGGKTTLCGKLAGRLPVLSDETVALRLDGPGPQLGGTPFWSGDRLPTASGLFRLAAICFLRKGPNQLTPMGQREALSELLLEWHLPERPDAAADALARANALVSAVPLFALHSTLEGDPLPLLRRAAQAGMQRAG